MGAQIHYNVVAQMNFAVNLIQQHLAENLEVDCRILPVRKYFSHGQPDRAEVAVSLPSGPYHPEYIYSTHGREQAIRENLEQAIDPSHLQ
jgi:hypothetical protein